ncbi:hypothetical protein J7T55_010617, partial [Diaporthe amygdali]|uniref:uncharacterized protein n=1 Tax=Phomopsis amygdali TaxID=1214568 RepID=UPI0022FF1109
MSMPVYSGTAASDLLGLPNSIIYVALFATSFAFILACTQNLQCQPKAWVMSPWRSPAQFGVLNTIFFLLNREGFLRGLLSRQRGSPAFIGVCGYGLYVAAPGEQVCQLLRSPHLLPSPGLSDALRNFFGMPTRDLRIFDHSLISSFEVAAVHKTNHPDPSRRIISHQRRDFALYFQGRHLRVTVERFLANLTCSLLDDASLSCQPSQLPDLYHFLFGHLFRAEVRALYGENVLTVSPSFCEDFVKFYEVFPTIAMGMSCWLSPSSSRARDTMLNNFKTWRVVCHSKSDMESIERSDPDYEPVWGTACIRKMVRRHEDLGFSDDGIASVMLGYLFVTMANSIPATLWMLLYILLDKDLASRVEAEVRCAFSDPSGLDVEKLVALPLLNSVYRETLRLRIAGAVGRRRPDGDMILGGCKIKRNTPVMFSNWLGGADDKFWNGSAVLGPYGTRPVNEFWAERFLVRPNAGLDGRASRSPEPGRRHTANYQDQGKPAKATLEGYWFPFGGGPSRCPGESPAKYMILSSVAVVLRKLHIELTDPAAAESVGSDHCFDRERMRRVMAMKFNSNSELVPRAWLSTRWLDVQFQLGWRGPEPFGAR